MENIQINKNENLSFILMLDYSFASQCISLQYRRVQVSILENVRGPDCKLEVKLTVL